MTQDRSGTVAGNATNAAQKRVWTTPAIILSRADETAKLNYAREGVSTSSGQPNSFGPS